MARFGSKGFWVMILIVVVVIAVVFRVPQVRTWIVGA